MADTLLLEPPVETTASEDPKEVGQKPPFDEPHQEPPGLETQMRNKPDHGEESYVGHNRLLGKVALITGGDSGIGRAVALAFAREGADVAISYLPEEEPDAKESAAWVEKAGRQALLLPGDITSEATCKQLIEKTLAKFGKLDVLVNNAAHQQSFESIQDISAEEWDKTFKTNIHAMFYLSKAALPHMKPGASIINTASINSLRPSENLLPYVSTKGAIADFSKALAKLTIKDGIRVNIVAPGPVWTPLIPATMPEEKVKKFGEDNPVGRPAQPKELSPVYVFLASDDASFVNGEFYGVAGGDMPL